MGPTKSKQEGKYVAGVGGWGGGWRRGWTCTRSHLGTLSNIQCLPSLTPGFVGGGVQHPGAKPVTLEAVRFGAQSGRGQKCPLPSSC